MSIKKSLIVNHLQSLKLLGALNYFVDHFDEMMIKNTSTIEVLSQLLIAEQNHVANKKIFRSLKKANNNYLKRCSMHADCTNKIESNNNVLLNLLNCQWINSKHDLIFTSKVNAEKNCLVSALGDQVYKNGFEILFYNTTDFFKEFDIAYRLGTLSLFNKKFLFCNLLILEDFDLSNVNMDWIAQFINFLDKYTNNGSLLIISRYETKMWLNHFENPIIGKALLDLIINRSYIFNSKGKFSFKKHSSSLKA